MQISTNARPRTAFGLVLKAFLAALTVAMLTLGFSGVATAATATAPIVTVNGGVPLKAGQSAAISAYKELASCATYTDAQAATAKKQEKAFYVTVNFDGTVSAAAALKGLPAGNYALSIAEINPDSISCSGGKATLFTAKAGSTSYATDRVKFTPGKHRLQLVTFWASDYSLGSVATSRWIDVVIPASMATANPAGATVARKGGTVAVIQAAAKGPDRPWRAGVAQPNAAKGSTVA